MRFNSDRLLIPICNNFGILETSKLDRVLNYHMLATVSYEFYSRQLEIGYDYHKFLNIRPVYL